MIIRCISFFLFWCSIANASAVASEHETLKKSLLVDLADGYSISDFYERYFNRFVVLSFGNFEIKVSNSLDIRYFTDRVEFRRLYIGNEYSSYLDTDLVLPDYNFIASLYVGEAAGIEYIKLREILGNSLEKCIELGDLEIYKGLINSTDIYLIKSELILMQAVTKNVEDLEYMLGSEGVSCSQ